MFRKSKIKNLSRTRYLQYLDPIPETIDHIKIMITLMDPLDLFSSYRIENIQQFSEHHLDLMYLSIRSNHCLFQKYLDNVLRYILIDNIMSIISCDDYHIQEQLEDQLSQDLIHIISLICKTSYRCIHPETFKAKLIQYLKQTWKQDFYKTSLPFKVSNSFFAKHDDLFIDISNKFTKYTKEILDKSYESSQILVSKLFDGREDVESLLDSFENLIDIDVVLDHDDHILPVYGETVLNSFKRAKSLSLIAHQ